MSFYLEKDLKFAVESWHVGGSEVVGDGKGMENGDAAWTGGMLGRAKELANVQGWACVHSVCSDTPWVAEYSFLHSLSIVFCIQ